MSRASSLGRNIRSAFGGTIISGIIVDIDNLEERSLVEVELSDGSLVNAVAWTQADLQPGNDVFLGRVSDSEHAVYAVVAANAPATGLDPADRDPPADAVLWSGKTFRPQNLPRAVGEIKLLREAKQVVALNFNSYTQMRVHLTFSVAPTAGRVTYWLYGYDITDEQLTTPEFMLEIGTNWKSSDYKQWRSIFDMMAPGAMAKWIDERDEAIFVLVLERTDAATRVSDTGRIAYCRLNFGDIVDAGEIEITASGSLDVELDDDDEIEIDIVSVSTLSVDQIWVEGTSSVYCEAIVLGAHDHAPYGG